MLVHHGFTTMEKFLVRQVIVCGWRKHERGMVGNEPSKQLSDQSLMEEGGK